MSVGRPDRQKIQTMNRLFELNLKTAFLIFAIFDLVCVGMGMGVPIFSILFGFLVGWYVARRVILFTENLKDIFKRVLIYATITSLFSFVVMCLIWVPFGTKLFDPTTDYKNLGVPFILYDPKISFVGWIVLMIFISPFLQLLTTIFASYLTLSKCLRRGEGFSLRAEKSGKPT
jgi:hypothetical protein